MNGTTASCQVSVGRRQAACHIRSSPGRTHSINEGANVGEIFKIDVLSTTATSDFPHEVRSSCFVREEKLEIKGSKFHRIATAVPRSAGRVTIRSTSLTSSSQCRAEGRIFSEHWLEKKLKDKKKTLTAMTSSDNRLEVPSQKKLFVSRGGGFERIEGRWTLSFLARWVDKVNVGGICDV